MTVVSNTSPINYLILIEEIDVLPKLFGQVTIPQAVYDELQADEAPKPVQNWIRNSPSWLKINPKKFPENDLTDLLDPGESEAILLAQELNASLLILDDMKARQIAIDKKLTVTGTLGVLDQSATRKLVNLTEAVNKLRETSFWASESLFTALLKRHQ